MKKIAAPLLATMTLAVASTAQAHLGHDAASGLMAGFLHPLTGLDHLLALVCVGALLAGVSWRARLHGVLLLIAALAAGAGVGLTGWVLPASEWVIAFSVLLAGLMLVRAREAAPERARPVRLFAGIALFALFHGYAHGVEASGQAAAFVAAFLVASTLIVLSALVLTLWAQRYGQRAFHTLLGTGAAVAGVSLLVSMVGV